MTDQAEILDFMRRFSFATLITAKDSLPIGTHLPFVISVRDGDIILTSHFARANEQWKDLESEKVMVIFNEPHAYISPRYYQKELNVPTWNYISVHAYGKGSLITEYGKVLDVLESTIHAYEPVYQQQWNNVPDDFRSKMIQGIVAFEIKVTEIQGKKKLSQNRNEDERKNIVDALAISQATHEQLIAEYMKA